jgi:hypothetical protein
MAKKKTTKRRADDEVAIIFRVPPALKDFADDAAADLGISRNRFLTLMLLAAKQNWRNVDDEDKEALFRELQGVIESSAQRAATEAVRQVLRESAPAEIKRRIRKGGLG